MAHKKKKIEYKLNTYDDPRWSFLLGLLAGALAYPVALRALDTASWQLYFLTLGLVIFCLNRFGHTVIYVLSGKAREDAGT